MIDTGNYYNDIISNIVAILEREKAGIGVKQIFPSVPPFIDLTLFPCICVTRQTKSIDEFSVVPARARIELIVEIWLQYCEIDQAVIEKVKNDITYAEMIEKRIGTLTQKIEAVLRVNRNLDGYCLESLIQVTDFRYRPQTARPMTIVAGSVINLAVKTKDIEVV